MPSLTKQPVASESPFSITKNLASVKQVDLNQMRIQLPRRSWRQGFRCEFGQDLVEFALVLPFILMLTIGVMDVARVVMIYNTISNAAREGARYGVVYEHANMNQIKTHVIDVSPGVNLTKDNIEVSMSNQEIEVNITLDVPLIVGYIMDAAGGRGALTLTASSRMRLEY